MTTVMGITHPNVDRVALVADRQSTAIDQAGIPRGKYLGRKLWADPNGDFALGHSGQRDSALNDFVGAMLEGKYDIERIVERGYFPELRRLNVKRMGRHIPNLGDMSGIILATRFEGIPRLYSCFPLGAVEERKVWTAIGSGDQKVAEYMETLRIQGEAKNYLPSDEVQTDDVLRAGLEAVNRAQSQDLYSSGLDLLVCTPEGIKDHRTDLDDNFGEKLGKIQEQHRPKDSKKKETRE